VRNWNKIKHYFLEGYDLYSLEIQKKVEYLLAFNLIGLCGLCILTTIRFFTTLNLYLLLGDISLYTFIVSSLIFIRLKNIHATSLSIIFILFSAFFYNIVSFVAIDEPLGPATLFSSLAYMIFGMFYLSFFSYRRSSLLIFILFSSTILAINYYFIVNSVGGLRYSISSLSDFFSALIVLLICYFIAIKIQSFSAALSKSTQDSLIESRQQYTSLFSNVEDAFCFVKILMDELGRPYDVLILEVNKAGETFLNLKREQIIFRKLTEILKNDLFDHVKWLETISGTALTGKESHLTLFSKLFNKWLYIQIFSPERGYSVLLFRDITEKVEADNALKKTQERNNALLDAIPDTIIVCDKDGVIIDYKKAQAILIENDRLFTLGKSIFSNDLPNEIKKHLSDAIAEVMRKRVRHTIVLDIPTQSRIIYTETRIVPLGENEILILLRDITRRKLSEIALVKAKEKAEESDKLKMAFLSNMSHEIRTPMNAIIGFSEMLEYPEIDEEEKSDFLYQIKSNGRLLLNLINDILDLSKIEAGQLEITATDFDINKVLHDIYLNFENEKIVKHKTGLSIILEKPKNITTAFIYSDEYRFKQILFNLMGNALKFTEKGSITLGYQIKDKNFLFYIKDTGIGIPADKLDLVFQRFRQVDDSNTRTFGGAGLGLTITKNLVEAMGGKIWVESKEKNGSEFYFTLPIKDSEMITIDPLLKSHNDLTYNWNDKTILIIEGETSDYVVLQHIFSKTGVKLEWGTNATSVLKICKESNPSLVIIDLQITLNQPGSIESRVKTSYPHLPIIALRSVNMDESTIKASNYYDLIIEKPLKAKTLLSAIDTFMSK
jgi:signal transduction histidine kinase